MPVEIALEFSAKMCIRIIKKIKILLTRKNKRYTGMGVPTKTKRKWSMLSLLNFYIGSSPNAFLLNYESRSYRLRLRHSYDNNASLLGQTSTLAIITIHAFFFKIAIASF